METRSRTGLVLALSFVLAGCAWNWDRFEPQPDAGSDVTVDTGSDVTVDTGSDVTVDTGSDVTVDAGSDVTVDTGSDVTVDIGSDGAACMSCSAPPAATATCTMGICGWECNPGYERVGDHCELRVPRPIAPLSTSTVTSQQPTFRWELAPGTDGASIEICRDRAFTVMCQTVDATGTSARPATALTRGVWFWRLRGRSGGRTDPRIGPVWEFTVGARSAARDTSWGTVLDVNGDGFADHAIGAPRALGERGRVYVHMGSAMGLSSTPALSLDGFEDGGYFGRPVASAGDLNGDGYADLVVGAPLGIAASVYVYMGSATGLHSTPALNLTVPDDIDNIRPVVASAGDLNGDGYADLVVGAPSAMSNTGRVHVYLGSAGGLSSAPALSLNGPDGANGYFGRSVASAGDLNGDGFADLVVAAPGAMTMSGRGRVHVYMGGPMGLRTMPSLSLTQPGNPDAGFITFASFVASAGDLNGDGFTDLVVGESDGPSTRMYVYMGSGMGLSSTPALSLTGLHAGDGSSVASAGDLNGDGFTDLVVEGIERVDVHMGSASGLSSMPALSLTEPESMGGGFGCSTSVADVNGDGMGDLAVGARFARAGRGRVYLYMGGASGLSSTPALSLTGPDANGIFGDSVASAGDLNSDGFADVDLGRVCRSISNADRSLPIARAARRTSA